MSRTFWIACGVLAAPAATAQTAVPAADLPANVSVANRVRPDYSPVGGRIGSFFLYPSLTTSAAYTSNLRAAEVDPVSDVVFTIRPAAQLESVWSRHALRVNLYYDTRIHAQNSLEDNAQYGGAVAGRYDVGPRTAIDLTADLGRVTEPRTDINSNLASRSPIQFTNLGGTAAVRHDFVRLGVIASGSIIRQSFENNLTFGGQVLDFGFRDNLQTTAALEGRLQVGAGTSVLGRVSYGRITFDENPLAGFDRNSSSYRVEGGVALQITRILSGDIRVGYFRQANDDPRFVNGTGLGFGANLLYNPTAFTSVRLTADRSAEPGGSVLTSGNIRSTGALTVDHEFLPNLVGTAFGRYAHVEPQGPVGSADEYEARAGATYFVNRRFRLNATASYIGRSSDAFGSFDVVTGLVGVTITL